MASWQKIFSHPSYKLFANYMITYLQGFLDCDACPSTTDLEPWSHTFSLRTHSLFNSLLFSSRLNITWSLLFRPLRKDLRPAIPFRSILPKDLFTSMKNVRNNFGTRFLAQLVFPCGSRLLSWKDLRFLKRVSNKGSVPAWFNYLIPSSHTVTSISFIDISQNYWFNPQWAVSFNRNTNSFLVGHVITTYPAPRCASALLRSSTSKTLLKRYPSEKCFSYVSLSSLIRYPTKPRTYIHADTRSVSLSASLGYAKSLLLFHLFAPDRLPPMNELVLRISDIQLPSSVFTLYIDGSFLSPPSHPASSMAYAWTAIDPDGFILESHYNIISSTFPSALHSEVFALLHGLDSLPRNSKITVATDCANYFLYGLRMWMLLLFPECLKNPTTFCGPPYALLCCKRIWIDIFDAKSLLTFAVLPRFNPYSSTSDIDWACTKFCLNNNKQFASHWNGRSEFCGFRIKLLLDMLPTLTTLQRQKPHFYNPSWLCSQCNSFPETLDHLWTCPYILPEFSPLHTFKTLLLALRTNYLAKFLSASSLIPLPDSFAAEFIALNCWNCDPPSFSCLKLARGLIPISLTEFLGNYFSSLTIWFILDTPLHDFHFDLYVQIWLCRSIFFHHWKLAQGITKKMNSSALGPSSILCPFSNIPLDSLTPSLATASLDPWFSLYLGFLFV
ncbi:hypothetical protein GLOIN_2v1785823 [Rhizophagus irregularis DAOM 181602=DAOM 197198]|nr:hypothetical protein GLOIN_2v1785823 [Rhizophagus irregularis DAOM 181602=DAOM 197198]